jgi:hypothetical protein
MLPFSFLSANMSPIRTGRGDAHGRELGRSGEAGILDLALLTDSQTKLVFGCNRVSTRMRAGGETYRSR